MYNGNISETLWKTSTDNQLRGYGYAYDALNRLKRGYFKRGSSTNSYKRSFDEALTYDKSGNITSLSRWGNPDHITAPVAANIDDLNYVYYPNTNKLRKVDDQTGSTQGFKDGVNTTNEYFYDFNGNMTKDLNKGITQITYNHLNLPTQITFTGNNKKINYLYNASGVKVAKKVTNGTTITTTQYLDGFQYVNGDLSFFPHAEGYVRINGNPAKTKYWYDYVYNYTDHLEGGALKKIPVEIFSERASLPRWAYLSFTKDRLTDGLKILQEHHYYPFGLEHHNYNQAKYDISLVIDIDDTFVIARNAGDYKYKYQGQERQDELGLNWDSFKWRNYDYAIGRFMSVDPLAENAPDWTPYRYAFNNPINFIDPNGLFETDYNLLKDGTITRRDPNDGSEKDPTDTLYAETDDGTTSTITVEKGIIENRTTGPILSEEGFDKKIRYSSGNGTLMVTNNIEDAEYLYEFIADNIHHREAGFLVVENSDTGILTAAIGINHRDLVQPKEYTVSSLKGKLLREYPEIKIIRTSHSHPGNKSNARTASGEDMRIHGKNKSFNRFLPDYSEIYIPAEGRTIYYNETVNRKESR